MLDANTVLASIRHGDIPKGWHVYHAKKAPFVLRSFLASLLTLFVLLIISGLSVAWGWPRFDVGFIVLVAVLSGLFPWFVLRRRAREAMLVITPDGFVQYTGSQTPFAVSYAELKDMQVEVSGRVNLGYTCSLVVRTRDEISIIELKLHYPDSRIVTWSPAKIFGPSLDIVPYINEGYVQYFALRRWGKKRMNQPLVVPTEIASK